MSKLVRYLAACAALVMCSGAALAAQWGYDTPIKAAARPAWVDNAVIVFPSPWKTTERKELVPFNKIMRDAGYTLVNMSVAHIPLEERSDWKDRDWKTPVHEEIQAQHKAGLKVIIFYSPETKDAQPEAVEGHPDWIMQSDDPTYGKGAYICLLSPYGDWMTERLASRIKEFDADGAIFDAIYQNDYCRCPHCVRQYKEDTGLDVPPKKDPFDEAYLKYLTWRDGKIMQLAEKMNRAVKAAKPGALLINWSNNDTNGCYPSFMPQAIDCQFGFVTKEWWDASSVSSIYLIKRLRGSIDDQPAGVQPYMFTRRGLDVGPAGWGSSTPALEYFHRMHKIMVAGSTPIYCASTNGWTAEDEVKMANDMVTFLPWVQNTKSLKYAAIVDSYTTLQMSKSDPADATDNPRLLKTFDAQRSGMARALLEAHIPFDVISEHNMTPELLAQYKVIIMPNNFCTSERINSLLRDYVAKGGGLIATGRTSLCDNFGNQRTDFALADLFAANYESYDGKDAIRVCTMDWKSDTITNDAQMKKVVGEKGKAHLYGRVTKVKAQTGAKVPVTCDEAPGLVINEYKQGRVAYFPPLICMSYFNASYPYERMLIANSIYWAARSRPQVEVTAPRCVFGGYFTKDDAKTRRTVVHLLNDICTTVGHGSIGDAECSIREESLPIFGVKVSFAGPKPSKAYLIPGKKPLALKKAGNGWETTVPRLDLHVAVVAEYAR